MTITPVFFAVLPDPPEVLPEEVVKSAMLMKPVPTPDTSIWPQSLLSYVHCFRTLTAQPLVRLQRNSPVENCLTTVASFFRVPLTAVPVFSVPLAFTTVWATSKPQILQYLPAVRPSVVSVLATAACATIYSSVPSCGWVISGSFLSVESIFTVMV